MESRKKNSLKILIATVTFSVLSLVFGLVKTREIIYVYGSTINGFYNVLIQLATFATIGELGLGELVRYGYYGPLLQKDITKVGHLNHAAVRFFQIIAIIIFVFAILSSIVMPFCISLPDFSPFQIIIITFCFILPFCVEAYYFPTSILVSAQQKNFPVICWDNARYIFRIGISLVIIRHQNFFVYILVDTLIAILFTLFKQLSIKKYNLLYLDAQESNYSAIRSTKYSFLYSISNLLYANTDRLVIMSSLSLLWVSIYSSFCMILLSIYTVIRSALLNLVDIIGSILSNQKEQQEAINVFAFMNVALFAISIIISIPFSIGINSFIFFVISPDPTYQLASPTLYALSLLLVVMISDIYWEIYIRADGQFHASWLFAFIEALLTILLSLILIKKWGLTGILIAKIITRMIKNTLYYLLPQFRITTHRLSSVFRYLLNILIQMIFLYFSLMIMNRIIITSLFHWFIVMIITTLLSTILACLLITLIYPLFWKELFSFLSTKKLPIL